MSVQASSVLAGREAELDVLLSTLGALDATGGRFVFVGGEAGIGKTRLIDELCGRARSAGALVAWGGCTSVDGGGLPYAPVVGALRDLRRQLDGTGAQLVLQPARELLGLVDRARASEPADTDRLTPVGKARLFEELLHCFTVLSERSRVLLVFEDVHWADSASLEFIDFFVRNCGTAPVLVVSSYRSDDPAADKLRPTLVELVRHRAVTELSLTGLDRDAISVLMTGVLGHEPDWALLDAVHGRCDGNPFFAEELTAARNTGSVPSLLRNVIMLRIEQLTPDARHVADVVSLACGSIDYRLLESSGDLSGERLTAAITEARRRHVLTIDNGRRLQFRHQLQSDAVYEAIVPSERARLHRCMAAALVDDPTLGETGPGHAAAELAGHYWEAGAWQEALHTSLRAADDMAAMLAMPEAWSYYERALSCYERLADDTERASIDFVGLVLKSADAAYVAGVNQRPTELLQEAIARIDTVSEPRRGASTFTALARSLLADGESDAAFAALQRAEHLLQSDPPSPELAGVLAEEARCLMLVSRTLESERRCHAALEVARACGARAEESHALCTLGCCDSDRGRHDEAIANVRAALAIAEELHEPDQLGRAYSNLVFVLLGAGRLEEGAAVVLDALTEGERLVGTRLRAAALNGADALIRLGRWDEADDLLQRMDDLGGCAHVGPNATRALLDVRRGDLERAQQQLARALEEADGFDMLQVRAEAHMVHAELALELRRPADAYAEIDHALAVAAGTDDNMYRPELCVIGLRALADEYDAARARARTVDVDKFHRLAAALVELATQHVPASDGAPRPAHSTALLMQCRAEESRLHTPDPELWQGAAAVWDAAHQPFSAAYCRWREAEAVLAIRGPRRRATEAASWSWATARTMGATPLREKVERLAQRARISLVAPETAPVDDRRATITADLGLTAREFEVLEQLAFGHSDKRIAEELYISRKTVSVHVSNILRKLDVPDRVAAAQVAHELGMGSPG